jgi:hypothetical protein
MVGHPVFVPRCCYALETPLAPRPGPAENEARTSATPPMRSVPPGLQREHPSSAAITTSASESVTPS